MDGHLNLPQISDALQSCMASLDILGFAGAAAYIDSAIRLLPGANAMQLNPPPLHFIENSRFDDIDFTELDQIIETYFKCSII